MEIQLLLVEDRFKSNRFSKIELNLFYKLFINRNIDYLDIYVSKHLRKCGNTLISFRSSNEKTINENIERYFQTLVKNDKDSNVFVENQLNQILFLSDADLEKLAS